MFAVLRELRPIRLMCFANVGGAFPHTLGRIDHGFKVRPDLCATEASTPPRDMVRRFYVDSLVHDAAALRYLVEVMGVDRVALGSDYPFPLGEAEPGSLVETIEAFSDAQRQQLLSGTAREFLAL